MEELSRKIVISQPIDNSVAGYVIDRIVEINDFDAKMASNLIGYQPEPIEMFINSAGGSATDGFAIIGAMETSDTPIITYGFGMVASVALAIFVMGDWRVASRLGRFMYHSVAYGYEGFIKDHESMHREADILQRIYDSFFLERTKMDREMMADMRHTKTDWLFSGAKALELGVADEVTKPSAKKLELIDLEEEASEGE